MNSTLLRRLLVTVLVAAAAGAMAATPPVTGKHAAESLTCKSCHRADEPKTRPADNACERCHTYEEVAVATAKVDPNPHKSHQGEIRCTLCHKTHEPSALVCNECHEFDLKVK